MIPTTSMWPRRRFLLASASLLAAPSAAAVDPAARADSVVLWVLVRKPKKAAVQQKGALLVGLGAALGMNIPEAVYDEIKRQAQQRFANEGVNAKVWHKMQKLEAGVWSIWNQPPGSPGAWHPIWIPASTRRVLKIRVFDPVGVARHRYTALGVGLAQMFGVDVDAKVQEAVRDQVNDALLAEGVSAAILLR